MKMYQSHEQQHFFYGEKRKSNLRLSCDQNVHNQGNRGQKHTCNLGRRPRLLVVRGRDRKSTRLNSSHVAISYAVFCLKKKKNYKIQISQQKIRKQQT